MIASDTRYKEVSQFVDPPNQLTVQTLSGVYNTIHLIQTQDSVDRRAAKEKIKYALWIRPTIDYNETGCNVTMLEAY